MTASIKFLKTLHPPLRWIPERKEFTSDFLHSKSKDSDGPSIEELSDGPDSVLQEAQRILGRCLPPTDPSGRETGLVVGYVQSGKTMSFETVIALARDNGYGLVIVIAGTKNNLREQSEGRLKKDLGIIDGGEDWYHLSNPTKTQRAPIESKISAWKRRPTKRVLLITVLKHGGHLEKLADVLKSVSLVGVPTLVIDDESDQASLNTQASKIRDGRVAADDKSTTYEKVLNLRDVLPHHSYLQYTAAPQANLLLAQSDLQNASFAEIVTPGAAYTGGQAFFGGDADLIVDIPSRDIPSATAPLTGPPKSLLKALKFFLLASAHHSLTRAKGLKAKDRNRSMMVHPTSLTAPHRVYKGWVNKALKTLTTFVERQHLSDPASVAHLFADEYKSLKRSFGDIRPLASLVAALVDDVFDEITVVEVNGTPDAEKKIDWKKHRYR